MTVCNTITFESLDIESSFLIIRGIPISRGDTHSSYMVIESRSRSQKQKRV